MRRLIYQLLLWLFLPILLLATIHQSVKRKGGRLFVFQRFGFLLPKFPNIDYWFHCASVGEVKAALPLIQNILKQKPDAQILITSNTPSSKSILKLQLNQQLHHSYLTLD